MKKLAVMIGSIICLKVMGQPKLSPPPRVINNYFVTKSSGCGGNCGGHCNCGKH